MSHSVIEAFWGGVFIFVYFSDTGDGRGQDYENPANRITVRWRTSYTIPRES